MSKSRAPLGPNQISQCGRIYDDKIPRRSQYFACISNMFLTIGYRIRAALAVYVLFAIIGTAIAFILLPLKNRKAQVSVRHLRTLFRPQVMEKQARGSI